MRRLDHVMSFIQALPEHEHQAKGVWREERSLGCGGFGKVTLWKNVQSDEYLALKVCRDPERMKRDKYIMERWQAEVDIMRRLDHPNIIKALPVPPECTSAADVIAPLAMEYCDGNSLQQTLDLAHNISGMSEADVRAVVRDVAAGVEYLHSQPKVIIHRDLKPANVILKSTPQGTTYKIIDLGFAKEINKDSFAESHVGTTDYLAPEFFIRNRQYTKTVDYWSLGILVYKCITGTNPFHLANVAEWFSCLKDKHAEDIHIFYNDNGDIQYTRRLPAEIHLSRTLQVFFEQWLATMLKFDPQTRGTKSSSSGNNPTGRPECFTFLDKILNAKIVHIMDMCNCHRRLTYPVMDHTVGDIKEKIAKELKEQEDKIGLMLASGERLASDVVISQYAGTSSEEMTLIFLPAALFVFPALSWEDYLPAFTKKIFHKSSAIPKRNLEDQQRAWRETIYVCQSVVKDIKVMKQCVNFMKSYSSKTNLVELYGKVKTMCEYFLKSVQDDIDSCSGVELPESLTKKMIEDWQLVKSEVMGYASVEAYVFQMGEVGDFPTIQENPDISMVAAQMLADAENLYNNWRKHGEGRRGFFDNQQILNTLTSCETLLNNAHNYRIKSAYFWPYERVVTRQGRMEGYIRSIEKYQTERQRSVWAVVSNLKKQCERTHLSPSDKSKLVQLRQLSNDHS